MINYHSLILRKHLSNYKTRGNLEEMSRSILADLNYKNSKTFMFLNILRVKTLPIKILFLKIKKTCC